MRGCLHFWGAVIGGVAICISMCFCERFDLGHGVPRGDLTVGGGRISDEDASDRHAQTHQRLLVSAIAYPQDREWRRDTVYGAVEGSTLMLLSGGDTLLNISSLKSLSPDMMHWVDGHFYIETVDGGQTVILRDGQELLRYDGREVLKGILEHEGDLYSLGQSRSSAGFALRRNGTIVYSRDQGYVVGSFGDMAYGSHGALYMDGDRGPLFSWYRPTSYEDGPSSAREWYIVEGETASRAFIDDDWQACYDLRQIGGELCMVGVRRDGACPMLRVGIDVYNLSRTLMGEGARDYRLFESGDSVRFYGTYNCEPRGRTGPNVRYEAVNVGLWSRDGLTRAYKGQGYLYQDSLSRAFVRMDGGTVSKIIMDGGEYTPKKQSRMFSYDCGLLRGDDLYLALTPSVDGESPYIWHNGVVTKIPINGYLTGIYLE